MQVIGAFEAKTHLSALLEKVEQGEQIVITKHGRPVAKLVSVSENFNKINAQTSIKKIKAFSQTHTLKGLNWKALRDEGKK